MDNWWKVPVVALVWGGTVTLLILDKDFPYPGWLMILSLWITGYTATYDKD